MHPLLKEIEEKLEYKYEAFRNGYHVFTKHYMRQDKIHHHYYKEDICELCEKPYMQKKWSGKRSHVRCANIMKVVGFRR